MRNIWPSSSTFPCGVRQLPCFLLKSPRFHYRSIIVSSTKSSPLPWLAENEIRSPSWRPLLTLACVVLLKAYILTKPFLFFCFERQCSILRMKPVFCQSPSYLPHQNVVERRVRSYYQRSRFTARAREQIRAASRHYFFLLSLLLFALFCFDRTGTREHRTNVEEKSTLFLAIAVLQQRNGT